MYTRRKCWPPPTAGSTNMVSHIHESKSVAFFTKYEACFHVYVNNHDLTPLRSYTLTTQISVLPTCLSHNVYPASHGHGHHKTFKGYYTRNVYHKAIRVIDSSDTFTLLDFWKGFNICDCLQVIKQAWDNVQPSTINAC